MHRATPPAKSAKPPTPFRRATTPADFLASPVGAALSRRTFSIYIQHPDRLGAVHADHDDPRDLETIAALFPMFAHPALAARYDILHDFSLLQTTDPDRFAFFEAFLRDSIDLLTARVRRVAVVRPAGLVGGALAGLFHDWVADRLDARLFADRLGAYAWLAINARDVAQIELEREALVGPDLLHRVRAAIRDTLASATLTSVAARLGTGPRTLQRQLHELGTSIRAEILQLRIDAAKQRLLAGDDKLSAVAASVGFSSDAAFCTAFQKAVGVTPSSFRTGRA